MLWAASRRGRRAVEMGEGGEEEEWGEEERGEVGAESMERDVASVEESKEKASEGRQAATGDCEDETTRGGV